MIALSHLQGRFRHSLFRIIALIAIAPGCCRKVKQMASPETGSRRQTKVEADDEQRGNRPEPETDADNEQWDKAHNSNLGLHC